MKIESQMSDQYMIGIILEGEQGKKKKKKEGGRQEKFLGNEANIME